jgi:hypothetical protein
MLGAEPVLLGAAGDERVLDDDTRGAGHTGDVVELLPVPDQRLVQEVAAENGVQRVEPVRLAGIDVHGAFRQRQASSARAGLSAAFIRHAKRHRCLVALPVRHAAGHIGFTRGVGDHALYQTVDPKGMDESVAVLFGPAARHHEGRTLAVGDRPADIAFVNSLLAGRLGRGERIAGVHRGIAEDHVCGTTKGVRASLGHHLDAAPAGPGELGRIRVLIDLDLLDRRWAHANAVRLDPVDDESDAVGTDGGGVEESRHRADIVLIEDRQVFERRLVCRNAVEIPGRPYVRLQWRADDGCLLLDVSHDERELHGPRRTGADGQLKGRRLETFQYGAHDITSGRDMLEAKAPNPIGRRVSGRQLRVGCLRHRRQVDTGARNDPSARIHDDTAGRDARAPTRTLPGCGSHQRNPDDAPAPHDTQARVGVNPHGRRS